MRDESEKGDIVVPCVPLTTQDFATKSDSNRGASAKI